MHTYGALLLLSIPLYYALLVALLAWLFEQQPHLLRAIEASQTKLLPIALLLLTWLLIIRLALYLWSGIIALVTPLHDDQSEPDGIKLEPEKHLGLWEELQEVGTRVQAPPPDEIYVTHRPECYATELRWFGFSTHRRLVLVLGLPHLAVLSVAELKVIVAHELAHFGGGDTRLSVFLFRFLRTLERFLTALDRKVEQAQRRWWRWLDPVYWYALSSFHLVRSISAPFGRYQELRADRRSASAYGGDVAGRTLLKEWQIEPRFDAAVASYCDQQLQDGEWKDVFTCFAEGWTDFSTAGYKYLEERLNELERPSFWDTHPTMQSRLAAVRAYPVGADVVDQPARNLIDDFAALASSLHDRFFSRLQQELAMASDESEAQTLNSASTTSCPSPAVAIDMRGANGTHPRTPGFPHTSSNGTIEHECGKASLASGLRVD